MTKLMYDGVTSSRLPSGADRYAGYVDGKYVWSKADWARWAGRSLVRIAVLPTTNDGHVLDVEKGNGTPEQAVGWVVMRRRAGVDPTVYIQQSSWPELVNAFHTRGVALPHIWVALWNGRADLPAGSVAHQYRNTPGYDVNVTADYWPGVDPAPAPAPPPAPPARPPAPPAPPPKPKPNLALEDDVLLISVIGTPGPEVYLVSGPAVTHVPTHPDLTALQGANIPVVSVSQDMYNALIASGAALKGTLSGGLNVSGTLNVS